MRYVLEFTASATREFRDLDKQLQRRITEKVTALCEDPFPPGSKKLKAQPDHFRIRVSDYPRDIPHRRQTDRDCDRADRTSAGGIPLGGRAHFSLGFS
jgi:hypothetical protein